MFASVCFFFFKQKTAYEMRISDWSSDVCSSDLLQFYPDAKIGIVGPNGTGKSTLMKIMAGIDKDFTGEAWPGEGISVGYLPQEPELDPTKTVKENVMDGVRGVADLMDRFNAISALMADPPEDADFEQNGRTAWVGGVSE